MSLARNAAQNQAASLTQPAIRLSAKMQLNIPVGLSAQNRYTASCSAHIAWAHLSLQPISGNVDDPVNHPQIGQRGEPHWTRENKA
jgi:hypothetical protein